jgi:1-acyl-sn-glycerol-3-phosphate acyltransferase
MDLIGDDMNWFQKMLQVIVNRLFNRHYHIVTETTSFDLNREEPYFLIGNHASQHDPILVGMQLRPYPYPVAASLIYTNKWINFGLTKMITSIPKRKGQSDIQTIRSILKAFNEDKRSIMIFPEGNASYFGEQTDMDFMTTAKLVKKLKKDVVLAKINGGYLSSPRWGKKRDKPHFHIHYQMLLTKEEMEGMSVDDIELDIRNALKFNDYDWNRVNQFKYTGKNLSEGVERYLYVCPLCNATQSLSTKKNDIFCSHCGQIAHFNDFGLIEGLPFDNLVPWAKLQKTFIPSIIENEVRTSGFVNLIDFEKTKRIKLGEKQMIINKETFTMFDYQTSKQLLISKIESPVIIQNFNLSFDYEKDTYWIYMKDPMLVMDILTHLKGV